MIIPTLVAPEGNVPGVLVDVKCKPKGRFLSSILVAISFAAAKMLAKLLFS